MITSVFNAYIGKKVTISCNGSAMGAFEGVITKVEDNWITLDEKRNTRIINCDAVNYITVKKDA